MPDATPPHESEEFQRALELLDTYEKCSPKIWPAGDAIIKRMTAEGRDPVPGALQHGDDRTRFLVTRNLQVMGPPGYRDELIALLDDPVDDVRLWAIWALETFDKEDPPVDAMIGALNDPHPRVRGSAAWNLSWFGDPRALDALLERARVVEGDEVQPVRDALSSMTARALDRVVTALKSEHVGVRRIVADALASAATGVIVCDRVEDQLGWTRETNDGRHVRPAIPAMIEALNDPDAEVRHQLLEALTFLEDPRATPAMKSLLTHPDPYTRVGAAEGLAVLGQPEGIDALVAALSDPDPGVRARAAGDLSVEDDGRVLPGLCRLLDDENADVRRAALWQLVVAADPRAEEPLRRALNDPDEAVRDAAREGLDRLQNGPEEA